MLLEVPEADLYSPKLYPYEILGAFTMFRKATIMFVMSVCLSARNSSAATERIFVEFDV